MGLHTKSLDRIVDKLIPKEILPAVLINKTLDPTEVLGKKLLMNVKEIIIEYLEKNGYEGISCEDECGCEISDLFPCGEYVGDCTPGYKVPCDPETCKAGGGCKFHIGEK